MQASEKWIKLRAFEFFLGFLTFFTFYLWAVKKKWRGIHFSFEIITSCFSILFEQCPYREDSAKLK